jgi:hypothetical protein
VFRSNFYGSRAQVEPCRIRMGLRPDDALPHTYILKERLTFQCTFSYAALGRPGPRRAHTAGTVQRAG